MRQAYLASEFCEKWEWLEKENENFGNAVRRFYFLNTKRPELGLPDFRSNEVRKEFAALIVEGHTKLESVWQSNLATQIEAYVAQRAARREYKELAPESLQVPSGVRHRVLYDAAKGPFLSVRLQEVFGWFETPRVCGEPVLLELLSPGFKPVQTTRDLKSFWATGYPEVRKELRARYPRHSWPDDPLTAPAVAKGRKR
jgi:ATP-dependent helicase HrpB